MNRNLVILSIVISLASVVFMFLQYYGIIRYCQCHASSSESYVESYKNTSRADYNGTVIISIAPMCTDLNKIKPFINSILDQTVHVDRIVCNLSDKKTYILPDFMKNTDYITVYKTVNESDNTSITKLVAPLLREKNGDCLIICLDDQVVYGKDFIENIIDQVNKFPDQAVCAKMDGKIINGQQGVAVKPSFFLTDVIDLGKGPKDQVNDFDAWITAQLARNKTKVNCINYGDNKKAWKYNNPTPSDTIRNKILSFYAAYL